MAKIYRDLQPKPFEQGWSKIEPYKSKIAEFRKKKYVEVTDENIELLKKILDNDKCSNKSES